jgi:hypothetical protein
MPNRATSAALCVKTEPGAIGAFASVVSERPGHVWTTARAVGTAGDREPDRRMAGCEEGGRHELEGANERERTHQESAFCAREHIKGCRAGSAPASLAPSTLTMPLPARREWDAAPQTTGGCQASPLALTYHPSHFGDVAETDWVQQRSCSLELFGRDLLTLAQRRSGCFLLRVL